MKSETATVVRCFDGRRYFTAKGAAGHEVSVQMRKKYCDCSKGGYVDPSEFWTCDFHRTFMERGSRYDKIAQRLMRWKLRCFKINKKEKV